jgi:2-keto-3-deoxy-L-fuconate dehydrogenase
VAIVTGGGSGIGRAIALRFAREGALVAVLDIQVEAADSVAAEATAAGGTALAFGCDVTDALETATVFARVAERLGPLDALINNAGVAHIGTVETTTDDDFERVLAVNVRGVFHCLRAAVPMMKGRGGAIVNLASIVSSVGIPERFAYSMSKGAVLTMTYSVACDYVGEGIRCNAIAPGRVHTPFVDGYLAKHYPGREEEMFERLARTQPIGRMGEPDEIAALAAFLCSDEATFITGSLFPIDGGFVTLKP